ncbi:MAG: TIGR04283 family arsenosugar biosynthesis glycosyltransferase [Chloroflexales bacterium]|nr:TIGR04283 family arsenosugar biosynthesis glycosyltransferase [Chloroflexales bacterium]
MLSIIIPVLNEAPGIAATLQALQKQGDGCEVIVVDGGSRDGTPALVRQFPVTLVERPNAPGGIAGHFNAAAQLARGDVLLFLHADVTLPPDTPALIAAALRDPAVIGGGFRSRFDSDHWFLRFSSWHMNRRITRGQRGRLFYGDMGPFVRREVFARIGGYPAIAFMEDHAFAWRLMRTGPLAVIDAPLIISARRFREEGVVRTVLWAQWIKLLFYGGVPPATLGPIYRGNTRRARRGAPSKDAG